MNASFIMDFGDGVKRCVFVDGGGDLRRISIDGVLHEFEMHPYCGPTLLGKNGDPLSHQPQRFLEVATLWAQQGERIGGDGLCIWDHPPEPIAKHIGGRNFVITGYTEPRRGS